MTSIEALRDTLAQEYTLSELQVAQLSRYVALLQRWNQVYRLIGSADPRTIWDRHVADSLAVCRVLHDAKTVLDLGCGAGLPGLIVKIARPEVEVTLLDALGKRINFCDQVRRELHLAQLRAIRGRAEDPGVIAAIGTVDVVVSRATWPVPEYLTMAQPFTKVCSRIMVMRGIGVNDRLYAAENSRENFFHVEERLEYELPISGVRHCLVVVGRSS